jgi:hypothetical protein
VFTQLQYFQENKERLGIIVDEYGEVQGLVTLEDIIEEMIGDFTTSMPGNARADAMAWNAKGECLLEGSTPLRDINKKLGLDLPLDGPKTVNGLLLELLQEIPGRADCAQGGGCVIEVVQVQNQSIKVVKLLRPVASNGGWWLEPSFPRQAGTMAAPGASPMTGVARAFLYRSRNCHSLSCNAISSTWYARLFPTPALQI